MAPSVVVLLIVASKAQHLCFFPILYSVFPLSLPRQALVRCCIATMFRFNLRQRPAFSVSSCAGAKLTRETLVLSLDFGYVLKKKRTESVFCGCVLVFRIYATGSHRWFPAAFIAEDLNKLSKYLFLRKYLTFFNREEQDFILCMVYLWLSLKL